MEPLTLRLPGHAGERLDSAVSSATGISRVRVQEMILQGQVLVEGRPAGKSYRLSGAEAIVVTLPEERDHGPRPQPIPITIVYQDRDMAVVSKQAGLVVHPAAGHRDGTLVNALLHALPDLEPAGGGDRPGIVHRLDRDTSGLLVVAKREESFEALKSMVRRREMERRYLALIEGSPDSRAGTIDAPLGRDPRDRRRTAVVGDGREAVTHFRVLDRLEGYTLVEAELVTGRTHQIRVHFAHIGHPVAGDRVYGRRGGGGIPGGLERQFLHAWRLDFRQPLTGEELSFTDPLPPDLAPVLEALGGRAPAAPP